MMPTPDSPEFYRHIINKYLNTFTNKQLMVLRMVDRWTYNLVERYLLYKMQKDGIWGASSILGSQAFIRDLGQEVRAAFLSISESKGVASVASDKITDAAFFNKFLTPSIKIVINIGSEIPKDGGVAALKGSNGRLNSQVKGPNVHGKAHAKFISGGPGVLFGSPNYTPNGLSGNTVESVAIIRDLRVKAYFNRYFQLMREDLSVTNYKRTGNFGDNGNQFKRLVNAFNASNQCVSLAFAPFVKISPWLLTEIDSFDKLIIRMFLISETHHGIDIVNGLLDLANGNKKMQIEVYVDQSQYESEDKDYVRSACNMLATRAKNNNIRVFTQHGSKGIMHDKLILASKTLPSGKTEKRVITGSSGFTTNVMENNNFDLMVRIDEEKLFNFMMKHHLKSISDVVFGTKSIDSI